MQRIKIYGERNTGTTYLEALIDLNFETKRLSGGVPAMRLLRHYVLRSEIAKDIYFQFIYPYNLGWKHSVPLSAERLARYSSEAHPLVILTITKNPYAWLLSMYKRPYHAKMVHSTFAEFVSSPWATVGRENAVDTYENPMVMWNAKNAAYLQLQASDMVQCMNLKYENLLTEPAALIEQIAEAYGLERKQPTFINYNRSTKENSKDFSYYSDYYLHERWKESLDMETVPVINSYLDTTVMDKFGYKLLDAS